MFFFWLKTAFLNQLRSGRFVAVLLLMIVTAVGALIFLSSLAVGVNDCMIDNSVSLYSGHIMGFHLPAELKKETLVVTGVKSVLQRVPYPGRLSSGTHRLPITLFTVDPVQEQQFTALWKMIIQGRYLEPGKPEIVISLDIAQQLGIGPGEDIVFNPSGAAVAKRLSVVGIYNTGREELDRDAAFCPAEVFSEQPGPWDCAVFLKPGSRPQAILDVLAEHGLKRAHFKSWTEMMPNLKQLTELNYLSMNLVICIVFGVVALGIACIFSIYIFKNIKEYGIMKSMGVRPEEIVLLISAEIVLVNLLALFLGCFVGVFSVLVVQKAGGIDLSHWTSHNQYFIVSGLVHPRLTAYSLLVPPGLALFFSFLASVWPCIMIIKQHTVDLLKTHG